jgi:hypothetical protein
MPGDLPGFRDEIKSGSRQGRHVQRLADMANVVRSAAVLVDKSASTGKIQKRDAP